jgi:hypothetical protein
MPFHRSSANPLRRLAEGWHSSPDDAALRDPNLAAEHAFADTRATSNGEPGCRYCHWPLSAHHGAAH